MQIEQYNVKDFIIIILTKTLAGYKIKVYRYKRGNEYGKPYF